MERIGFICDIRETSNPMKVVGPSRQHRAVPMASVLREAGVELFAYSRKHINATTKMAFGYVIGDSGFIPTAAPVPRVNGNWFFANTRHRNRSGMNHWQFTQWAREHGIEVYPPYEFLRLTLDKLLTFRLLSAFDPHVHPYTEKYDGSRPQLERFLDRGPSVFLKPRFGSQGQNVLVLKSDADALSLARYAGSETQCDTAPSVNAILPKIDLLVDGRAYVIQAGVDVKRHEGAAFIIRVIMLNDGIEWSWAHKLVMARAGGDVANTTQGGLNFTIGDELPVVFGASCAARVIDELRTVAFRIARHLDTLYPGSLMELAFDFLLDQEGRVYLAEMDVQPGLMRPGMDHEQPFQDIFSIRPEERPVYDRYVAPHARCLARFLLSKLDLARADAA